MLRKLLLVLAVLALLAAGAFAVLVLKLRERPSDRIDTKLEGVSLVTPTVAQPSTPAIAGARLIVSSVDGTVTAYDRANGRLLWRLKAPGKVESSPVVLDNVVFFGTTDGRLFAVYVRTGRVKWAYDTGGRINASPSIHKGRVCITTYAGSIFCLSARDGHKIWRRYFRRDFARYESFYASASTDGHRLFTIARSGKVIAPRSSNRHVLWTKRLQPP